MKLSTLSSKITPYLPQLPSQLHYHVTMETIDSNPNVVVILHDDEHPLFSCAIPLQDVYYLAFPPEEDTTYPYYNFSMYQSETSEFTKQEILDITAESAQTLHDSFQRFLNIFLPIAVI